MIREYDFPPQTTVVLPEYRFLARDVRRDIRNRIHPAIHRKIQVIRPEKPHPEEFFRLYGEGRNRTKCFSYGSRYSAVFWNAERCLQPDFDEHFRRVIREKDVASFEELVNFDGVIRELESQFSEGIFASHYHLNEHRLQRKYSQLDSAYAQERYTTGIGTFSTVPSNRRLVVCSPFREPLFGSYKASVCTFYPIGKGNKVEDTLLVINAHTSLFWGMRHHLRLLYEYISSHTGPIIAHGDWNTWRRGQETALQDFASSLGLTEISLGRFVKQFDNRPLDRLFVRRAKVTDVWVEKNDLASDHSSIEYAFRLER